MHDRQRARRDIRTDGGEFDPAVGSGEDRDGLLASELVESEGQPAVPP